MFSWSLAEVTLAEIDRGDGTRYRFVRRSILRLAGLSLVALSTSHGDAFAREVAGSVEELKGEAFAQAEQQRRTLENAAPIFLGDEVSTGLAAKLTIRLGKETTVRLGELVHLMINLAVKNAGGELVLSSGALLFDRAPSAEPRPLHIRSSFGLIAVRGNAFFCRAQCRSFRRIRAARQRFGFGCRNRGYVARRGRNEHSSSRRRANAAIALAETSH